MSHSSVLLERFSTFWTGQTLLFPIASAIVVHLIYKKYEPDPTKVLPTSILLVAELLRRLYLSCLAMVSARKVSRTVFRKYIIALARSRDPVSKATSRFERLTRPVWSSHTNEGFRVQPPVQIPQRAPANGSGGTWIRDQPADCVGKNLALAKICVVVALLLQRFEIRFADDYDPRRWENELEDLILLKIWVLPVVLTLIK
ncbi:hypothetical protein DFH11DRAFT_1540915 [Phellopilus nigrolimitatus]|nr:hypothetical protein DFH11DRAFT_1540915 [Phellopilus nigrolimitatus]